MQWSTITATAVGAVLGVMATLVAEHVRRRHERADQDRETLLSAFTDYLAALARARTAFSKAQPAPEDVGRGHVAISEHGVYAAHQQLELVAPQLLVEKAGRATLSVLDFHDVVVAGHTSGSREYVHAWRAARQARAALIAEMRLALRQT
ncbi:hypothetical protein K7472_21235 [Streptomyces sp. PTM05]|uniref:Uncharacterized protein n=1 Tax=Streptantibioticus parmotrematis TaxID=2873249 RepID=A0ABS7QXE7_9ACTN|nr:hypothetical protein [Streptantibioticus parmotrematis]MBY8887344.1 hypothetical protein [Streptantibioticus parmotrematis]